MTDKLISVVLPVHNQEDHITEIVRSYIEVLGKIPGKHEIVLVTNACRDRSAEICKGLESEYPGVVRAFDTERGGWGLSVKLGLEKSEGEILCYTNSARTSSEILTLSLLYAVAYPKVVIKANRKIRDSWRRRLGSLIYNLECRAFFDLPTWDINGTPKVFPRNFEKLLKLTRDDDLIDAEFNAICRRENYPMLEVPVLSTKRHGGKSTTNYNSALKMYWGAYELWRSMRQPMNS
ncbi:MAG TPA: glycosyltransferase [Chroococcales cyanobacterium]